MGKEDAVVGVVTEDQVKALIAEAVKDLVTKEGVKILIVGDDGLGGLLAEALKGYATEEQVVELSRGAVTEGRVLELIKESFLHGKELMPLMSILAETEEKPELNPAWLKGLKFKTSRRKESKEPGQRATHEPIERQLKPEDVIALGETDTHVVIVAADGQKHEVPK